jgi:hypothetical protein
MPESTKELSGKRCSKCREDKPVTAFCKCSRAPDGLNWYCRSCDSEIKKRYYNSPKGKAQKAGQYQKYREQIIARRKMQTWYRRRPEYLAYHRDRHLRTKYGLSLSDYNAMLESQGGGCSICGQKPAAGKKSMPVDHCHQTGAVRGILCDPCNRALEGFQDSPTILRSAIAYLHRAEALIKRSA